LLSIFASFFEQIIRELLQNKKESFNPFF